ncbi:MAG: hypothetical protein GY885_03090 [Phycisphaeraceae bacterium]|nr:hypothetical protein [Phycisphaeraceae bacterium]
MAGRHREAIEKYLEVADGDPVTVETCRGLADRWDQVEQSGEGTGQIPQIAAVLLQSAEKLVTFQEDALASLENALKAV